jgi:hypothetical protein
MLDDKHKELLRSRATWQKVKTRRENNDIV